jgi:hypothetical protein
MDDESWELVWPPCIDGDQLLVSAVVSIVGDQRLFGSHNEALERLNRPSTGIDGECSLVDELRRKSGKVSEPFIEEALKVFDARGTADLAITLSHILLSTHVPSSDGTDETEHEIRSIELYMGCVWEIAAMFACELVSILRADAIPPPSSCLTPVDRARYILSHS